MRSVGRICEGNHEQIQLFDPAAVAYHMWCFEAGCENKNRGMYNRVVVASHKRSDPTGDLYRAWPVGGRQERALNTTRA